MDPLPSLVGRYQVRERLGHGGMGTLYLALDPTIERLVALKVLRVDDVELRERFLREARLVARLQNPNIITIYDVGSHDGQPFIAMEYVAGDTLDMLIKRRAPLAVERKIALVIELCDALAYAHRTGIVHRDIKPSNLIVQRESGLLKVLDFGIARTVDSSLTQAGSIMGTPNYMAPEQVEGLAVDQRSDIFAVGAVTYELLTYRQAFAGETPFLVLQRIVHGAPEPLSQVDPTLNPALQDILDQALAKDPAARYPDLTEMRTALKRVLRGGQTGADDRTLVVPPSSERARPRRGVDLVRLVEERAARLADHLREVDAALAIGELDRALAAAEDAAFLDPDDARVAAALDRARSACDARNLSQWLEQARRRYERGALTEAARLVTDALQIEPGREDAVGIQRDVERAIAARERKRERDAAVERAIAHANAAEAAGHFESARRAAREALGYDPLSTEALEVRQRIERKLETDPPRTEARREPEEPAALLWRPGFRAVAPALPHLWRPRLRGVAAAVAHQWRLKLRAVTPAVMHLWRPRLRAVTPPVMHLWRPRLRAVTPPVMHLWRPRLRAVAPAVLLPWRPRLRAVAPAALLLLIVAPSLWWLRSEPGATPAPITKPARVPILSRQPEELAARQPETSGARQPETPPHVVETASPAPRRTERADDRAVAAGVSAARSLLVRGRHAEVLQALARLRTRSGRHAQVTLLAGDVVAAARRDAQRARAVAVAVGARTKAASAFARAEANLEAASRRGNQEPIETARRYWWIESLFASAGELARRTPAAASALETVAERSEAAGSRGEPLPPMSTEPPRSSPEPDAGAGRVTDTVAATPAITMSAATATPAPVSSASAGIAVRQALDRWASAYGTRDIGRIRSAWPTIKPDEARRLTDAFRNIDSYSVFLSGCSVSEEGDRASAGCSVRRAIRFQDGRRADFPARVTFRLERRGSEWVIVAVSGA